MALVGLEGQADGEEAAGGRKSTDSKAELPRMTLPPPSSACDRHRVTQD